MVTLHKDTRAFYPVEHEVEIGYADAGINASWIVREVQMVKGSVTISSSRSCWAPIFIICMWAQVADNEGDFLRCEGRGSV